MMNTQTESVTKLYCFSLHEQYMNYVGYLTKQFARLEYAFHAVFMCTECTLISQMITPDQSHNAITKRVFTVGFNAKI